MSVNEEESKFQRAVEMLKPLEDSINKYEKLFELMANAMEKGLCKETNGSTSMKMYPSYVTKIPNGTEKGEFLVMDLGESLYRVLVVRFTGSNQRPEVHERTYNIPQQKLTGTAKEFFAYLAETLKGFMVSHNMKEGPYLLGFTFAFPCVTQGLTNTVIQRWTKGFNIPDAVGQNPVLLLQKAIDKAHIPVNCSAIVNDTVGTLASCAIFNPQCAIGLISGIGTNAAYIEAVENVELMITKEGSHVIINTEWGGFGDMGELDELLTPLDRLVDENSLHPKMQTEMPDRFANSRNILSQDLFLDHVGQVDVRIFRYVCDLISKRSAYFIGAGVACLLHRIKRGHVVIGVDGCLFKFHPRYTELMSEVVDKLKPPDVTYTYKMTDDGSGLGVAAIVAALGQTNK